MSISGKKIILLHYIEKNIEEVSKNLGISERTIRYRIKSLNEFFVDEKINYKITIKNGIIKGSGNFSNLLESVKREDYDFSKEERIEIIHFLLLLLSYGCKADAICYLLNISRSTLKSDMKFVRKKLVEKNLQICSRTKRGLIIQGREILIRKLLWEEYKKILRIEGKNVLFLEEANRKKVFLIKKYTNLECISSIIVYLENLKLDLNKKISDEAYQFTAIYLLIAVNRLKHGIFIKQEVANQDFIKSTSEFQAVQKNIFILERKYQIKLNIVEIIKITEFILGAHSYNFNDSFYENWIDIEGLADDLITRVNQKMDVDISMDRTLREGLINHLVPTIYRLKNGIELQSSIYQEVMKKYSSFYYIVKKSLERIEKFIGKEFSENETSFFVIHFVLSIKRVLKEIEKKKKILIVCGLGYGISNLLKQELEELFDIEVKDIIPLNHLRETKLEGLDLIISTTEIDWKEISIPIIKVSSLLNKDNIAALLTAGIQTRKNQVNISKLVEIIQKYCYIWDKEGLVNSLVCYDDKRKSKYFKEYEILSLSDMLPVRNIKVLDKVCDWQKAMIEAGEILYENGYITKSYINKMIEKVKELGVYMLIGDSVILPHAEPEKNVMKTGISYLQLKEYVMFPENILIKHIFVLASRDKKEHINGVLALKQNLDEHKLKEILESCKTVQEMFDIFKNIG